MTGWRNIVWALAAVVALASPAFAQGGGASSTGSISGEIKDAQGGVLPGVTVTATSPAQIGALTAVTNEAGIYRFPSVPPGEYRLAFELAGFQSSVRDGIRITLGFNAQVNVTLNVATLQETVTVSGQSPVIDTSATRIQTNYDQQMLSSIPNARDMWSLLATTPSVTLNRVDVGGTTAGTQTTYFAYGYSGQNRPLIEGINTTEGTAAAGFYLDYGSFEEVFIGAAGNSAEMPNPGVLTQFVGKSGGNRPSVSLYYDYENEDIQGRNLAADQIICRRPARRSAPTATASPATRTSTSASAARHQRPHVGPLLVPEPAELGGGAAGRQLPRRHAVQHQAVQLHRQGHLPGEPVEQVHRLPAARHQGAAEPHRQQQRASARRCTSPPIRRCCRRRRAGSTRANGTARSARTCSSEFRAGQFGYNFGLDSNTNDTRYEVADDATKSLGGGRDWELRRAATSTPARSATSRIASPAARTTSRSAASTWTRRARPSGTRYYKDNVIHFVNGSLQGPLSATTPVEVRLTTNGDSWSAPRRRPARSSPTPGRSTS